MKQFFGLLIICTLPLHASERTTVVTILEAPFYEQVIAYKKPTIVEFFATWCPTCLRMAETYSLAARTHTGRVKCISVDVDRHKELAKFYHINAVPTFLFFKDGKLIHSHTGATDYHTFVKIINDTFAF